MVGESRALYRTAYLCEAACLGDHRLGQKMRRCDEPSVPHWDWRNDESAEEMARMASCVWAHELNGMKWPQWAGSEGLGLGSYVVEDLHEWQEWGMEREGADGVLKEMVDRSVWFVVWVRGFVVEPGTHHPNRRRVRRMEGNLLNYSGA